MPDYSKSKIYKIVPTCEYEEGDEYYGSTTRPLSERMNEHRRNHKYKETGCYWSTQILFDKYGIENCKIELFEEYSCSNKEQLVKREGEIMRANKCINKRVEGRTSQEWELANWDKRQKDKKERYLKNADKINENKRNKRKLVSLGKIKTTHI